jgi:hypothetical protein
MEPHTTTCLGATGATAGNGGEDVSLFRTYEGSLEAPLLQDLVRLS